MKSEVRHCQDEEKNWRECKHSNPSRPVKRLGEDTVVLFCLEGNNSNKVIDIHRDGKVNYLSPVLSECKWA